MISVDRAIDRSTLSATHAAVEPGDASVVTPPSRTAREPRRVCHIGCPIIGQPPIRLHIHWHNMCMGFISSISFSSIDPAARAGPQGLDLPVSSMLPRQYAAWIGTFSGRMEVLRRRWRRPRPILGNRCAYRMPQGSRSAYDRRGGGPGAATDGAVAVCAVLAIGRIMRPTAAPVFAREAARRHQQTAR